MLTEGMGTTDDEAEIVLADIAAHREHHNTGIDRQAVREMVRNWRAEAHRTRMVSLPADSLETLLNSAGRWLVSGGGGKTLTVSVRASSWCRKRCGNDGGGQGSPFLR